ncbi:unnamed protein product [Candida verbasci]|uniref:Heat shock transcription factor n=1 Tax=Candida verbasci TaxID=1227364 RepID=A0A9W4TTH1_9ASCO|nr:unnamed protein product [Candida verbasci]
MNTMVDYKDPIIELLNSETENGKINKESPDLGISNDDIEYINKQGSSLTPLLNNHQPLYTATSATPNGFDHFSFDDGKIQELDDTPPQKKRRFSIGDQYNQQQQPQVKTEPLIEQPTGQTPLFVDDPISDEEIKKTDQQHQELIPQEFHLINNNQNNHHTNFDSLPPLQPLSESVIPNGINITPLVLPEFKNESNNQHQQNPPKRKKESTGPKARPAFVMKIWSMVNDPANKEYIRWNEDGKTFQVFHREDFMKIILPKYFKHNNFASFVRQLNMYGWHKVQDISNGTLNSNCDKNGGNDEIWQFENPNFSRNREDLLDKIVRNKSNSNQDEIAISDNINTNNANISLILQELENIKMNQYTISEELRRIRSDNKTLWHENYLNRERNEIQGRTLEKILKFLSVVYGNNANKSLDINNNQSSNSNGYSMTQYKSPIIKRAKATPPEDNKYFPETNNHKELQKYRLMLTDSNQKRPSISRTKSTPGSIEEIIRSYDQDKSNESNNVNIIYQQLINDSIPGPRLLNQDLSIPNTPKNFDEFERNIQRTGHSLQQVQDWIERLDQNGDNNINTQDDDFDVNEFLQNTTPNGSTSNINSPVVITPGSTESNGNGNGNGRKRSIREIYENKEESV